MIGKRAALGAILLAALLAPASAQTAESYRQPPPPIAQILDTAPTPTVSVSSDRRTLALLGRENLPPIADLAEPFLRLAGYRINPAINGPSEGRAGWLNALSFQDIETGAVRQVALPAGARYLYPSWSPDSARLAFALRTPQGLELWAAERASGEARRLSGPTLNAAFGLPYRWTPDSAALFVLFVREGRGPAPSAPTAPSGPVVQESGGRSAPARTYQDLFETPHDEALFEHYFTAQIARVDANSGVAAPTGAPALYMDAEPSPDGRFLLVTQVKRPFSYVVPASRFPTEISVWDMNGRQVHRIVDRPLADDILPAIDAVVTGPRSVMWRADAPATLVWAETQDRGDPAVEVAVRDRIYMLAAPFRGRPRVLAETGDRYAGISWGRDDFAILYSRWFNTRNEKRFAISPSRPGAAARLLLERNYQDRYNNPGAPVMRSNGRGQALIHFAPDGQSYFQTGPGATREGEFPFLDRITIADGANERVWRAEAPGYEALLALVDDAGQTLLTRRENAAEPPNFFLRPIGGGPRSLTSFPDPAPQFAGVSKRLITYQRADGVTLSGNLYLPPNYDPARDGPLPTLLWAYPTEFTDAAVAGQVVDEANRFVRPAGSSHLFLLTQGYAVLDNPRMPIIGVDGAEPNDTYVEQLTASAEAAVNALVEMGVADRRCVAIGGHSYGAFMTANLLAHTDLFRAGIARSGAYNRTLTPFGFQAEQRPYWQAVETYTRMSPFTFANQINEPILLIHGEADDNSGTFPVQSERMFAALKGNGATVRYVVLPHEAHGYRARESVGHALWEMHAWLERHVRPACARR
jgi:dipeptidyl aminopeptidase/acylaminoacyl peptidase